VVEGSRAQRCGVCWYPLWIIPCFFSLFLCGSRYPVIFHRAKVFQPFPSLRKRASPLPSVFSSRLTNTSPKGSGQGERSRFGECLSLHFPFLRPPRLLGGTASQLARAPAIDLRSVPEKVIRYPPVSRLLSVEYNTSSFPFYRLRQLITPPPPLRKVLQRSPRVSLSSPTPAFRPSSREAMAA